MFRLKPRYDVQVVTVEGGGWRTGKEEDFQSCDLKPQLLDLTRLPGSLNDALEEKGSTEEVTSAHCHVRSIDKGMMLGW